jgi:hypothetical protein
MLRYASTVSLQVTKKDPRASTHAVNVQSSFKMILLCAENCTKKFHTLMDEVVDGQPFKDIPQKDWKRYY